LLGVTVARFGQSFPVGKVRVEHLYPMDFEEFLIGLGEDLLREEIEKCFKQHLPMNEALHAKAMDLFRTYLFVGGMPQCVQAFVDAGKRIVDFDRAIQKNLIVSYLADMGKHATGSQAVKNVQVYDSMPAQLAKENTKFKYALVNSKAKAESHEHAIEWLLQADLLLKSRKLSLPQKPLKAHIEKNGFKLFVSDVGLLGCLCGLTAQDIFGGGNLKFKGSIAENFVAQTFRAHGHDLYYWESKAQAEVDFVLDIAGDIVPVEVKAAENVKAKSLTVYAQKYHPKYSIRISGKNFGWHDRVVSVPLYAAHCVGRG
jgi:predicted AAA+ superfamily ATPase